nr:glutathione S-transferase GSTS4-1 [Brachionus angularis]
MGNAHYKLYYFNFRFRGEVIRLLFTIAGVPFEDVRFEPSKWSEYKKDAPFGTAPYLEITNGSRTLTLAQTTSIARYLARKFRLAGKSIEEQAVVDMFGDQVTDIMNEFVKTVQESDENKKKQIMQHVQNEVMPNNLKLFEARIAESRSGYLVPSGLTWTDLYLFNLLEMLADKKDQVLQMFPNIKKLDQNIRSNPRIAAYLAKRQPSAF